MYHTVQAIHRSKETTNGAEASHPAFGFIVEIEPGVTYYHVGDTCLFSDMRMYRELYHPHVMTVGISSFKAPYPPCEMPPARPPMRCPMWGRTWSSPPTTP